MTSRNICKSNLKILFVHVVKELKLQTGFRLGKATENVVANSSLRRLAVKSNKVVAEHSNIDIHYS